MVSFPATVILSFLVLLNRITISVTFSSSKPWRRKIPMLGTNIIFHEKKVSMVSNDNIIEVTYAETSSAKEDESDYGRLIANAIEEHEKQYQNGVQTFGCSSEVGYKDVERMKSNELANDDFVQYHVKKGHAGPSESFLKNGNYVFETKEPILTPVECQEYIEAAKDTIEKERTHICGEENNHEQKISDSSSSTQRSNSDLGEARISKLPEESLQKLKTLLKTKLYPILSTRFGVDDITVYDGLILGHIAPSISQPVHRDASLLTINIPLSSPNEDYNGGGGTYIEGLENHNLLPLCIAKGKVLCHSSGIMHAGIGIEEGERWVMVLFVIAKNESQIARRLHASALYAISSNELKESEVGLKAGLDYAPKDHLLTLGLGQIAAIKANNKQDFPESIQRKENKKYIHYLQKAVTYYPHSYKASITIGKTMEERKKPRAALRHFEMVLSIVDDRDLIGGAFLQLKAQTWDARVCAARCAIICVDRDLAGPKKNLLKCIRSKSYVTNGNYASQNAESTIKNKWSNSSRLKEAIERLDLAIIPSPNNGYLISLRKRALQLLEYTNKV